MARVTKPQRYQEILSLPNVTVLHHYFKNDFAAVRGKWNSVFQNDNPITLELACGKGDYALALGNMYPDRNFIGIDIKGDRLWKGALTALQQNQKNVHFLRARIEHICNYFAPSEVDEIWITFPDPFEKTRKKRKRLTHPLFLQKYAEILKPDGIIHLKTDSDRLFEFTNKIINIYDLPVNKCYKDMCRVNDRKEEYNIQTYYERQHLEKGLSIKYVSFQLDPGNMDPDHPALDDLD